MPNVDIPPFLKDMGPDLLGFILNLNEDETLKLLGGAHDLSLERTRVLQEFITLCREIRRKGTDDTSPNLRMLLALPRLLVEGRHVFNRWHEQLGGERIVVETEDPVLRAASNIALEVYPLSLLKTQFHWHSSFPVDHSFNFGTAIYSLGERPRLLESILADTSLRALFTHRGQSDLDTYGQFKASTGRGGGFQLAIFPDTLVAKSYELMRLRGNFSRAGLLKCVADVIVMLRNAVDGSAVVVPAFIGFRNVGFDTPWELTLSQGKLRVIHDELAPLIPNEASASPLPQNIEARDLILEVPYAYQVAIGEQHGKSIVDAAFEAEQEKLTLAEEDLSLVMALAIERPPAVGLCHAWTLIFDPLSPGPAVSWSPRVKPPMPRHIIDASEIESLRYWSRVVNESDNSKIRIAIRRILSAIGSRPNPVDGFIDAIIAWENLFGANAELSFRISVSIAKLLTTQPRERRDLQDKAKKLYAKRSQILHGTRIADHSEAVSWRDESLQIVLDAMRRLYEEYPELLSEKERSTKLALM